MRQLRVGFAAVALAAAATTGSLYGQERGEPGTRGQSGSSGASTQRPEGATTAGRSDSRTFVNEMAIAGMAEIQLGKMAAERGANADVKSFGQMMVTDHSKANEELKQAASQLNIQPTMQLDEKHRNLAEKLSKLRGAEFDREYMNAMVEGHQEVLSKLRERAGGSAAGASGTRSGAPPSSAAGTDKGAAGEQALTQWAAKTMPAVQQHLERARNIQQKVAK